MDLPEDVQIERGHSPLGPEYWRVRTGEGTFIGYQAPNEPLEFFPQNPDRAAQQEAAEYSWELLTAADEPERRDVWLAFRAWQLDRDHALAQRPRQDEMM